MDFNEPNNYYDVLDVAPSASPSEVREAYYRAKAAYNKDSIALYSLIDPEEREDILFRIEKAYEILSNEEKRRAYDTNNSIIETTGVIEHSHSPPPPNVVSIDRVPPMEALAEDASDALLVAPTTDFPASQNEVIKENFQVPPAMYNMTEPPPMTHNSQESAHAQVQSNPPSRPKQRTESPEAELAREVATEVEWRGTFVRHVREALRISIEEMSSNTKLSKTYITAIEEENFSKLPAAVFVRGFLVQIARILRLPQDKFLEAYLQRFKTAKKDQ
jgi:hypothetical protein